MSNEEINRAIAEACGIDISRIGVHQYFCPTCGEVDANHSFTHQTFVKPFQVPDYCSDLNAMAEAEKTLTDEQAVEYSKIIQDTVPASSHFRGAKGFHHVTFKIIHATAHQRALAFLKTVAPKL